MKPVFFKSPAAFRAWLVKEHRTARELWIGFYKKSSNKKGITYGEALDQALCFGWIDGIVRRLDEHAYMHRFSPRQAKSVWSAVNIKRVGELRQLGLLSLAGLEAFERRDPARSAIYSHENRLRSLSSALERRFRSNKTAFAFFREQPPGYRRTAIWWVMSAKKDDTRLRRLDQLIESSGKRRRIDLLTGRAERGRASR